MTTEEWDDINEHMKSQQFVWGITLPISWKATADMLKHAADHLYDLYYEASERQKERTISRVKSGKKNQHTKDNEKDAWDSSLIRVYFMLVGYAIENLLKAAITIQNPDLVKKADEFKLDKLKSHDLVRLCNMCDLELTDNETKLLQRLTDYIIWMGKYPVPLKKSGLYPKKDTDGAWVDKNMTYKGRDNQLEVDAIYQKLNLFIQDLQSKKIEKHN